MYIYYRRELIVIVKRRILNHEDYSRDKEPDAVNPSGTCVSNRHVPTLLRLPDGTHRSVLREEVFPLPSPPPRERANLEIEDEGRDSGVEIRGRGTSSGGNFSSVENWNGGSGINSSKPVEPSNLGD